MNMPLHHGLSAIGLMQELAIGKMVRGSALTLQGPEEAGTSELRQAIDSYRATGARLAQAWFPLYLAQAYGNMGQPDQALTILARTQAFVEETDERWNEAELYRIKGEVLLGQGAHGADTSEAEECFQKALTIARRQHAKSDELRAATSLARLWQSQGKQTEARHLLSGIYDWFTEGFDTADLKDAKALLVELS